MPFTQAAPLAAPAAASCRLRLHPHQPSWACVLCVLLCLLVLSRIPPCPPLNHPSTHRSKADEVTDERDRQRVLIQITQNLATRIRNSHAFNLPTFYLPHEDDGGLPCSIPNAIEDVCEEIDKVCCV